VLSPFSRKSGFLDILDYSYNPVKLVVATIMLVWAARRTGCSARSLRVVSRAFTKVLYLFLKENSDFHGSLAPRSVVCLSDGKH